MSRALTIRSLPPAAESRDARLRELRERRALAKGHGCNYWVFADESDPDALVEFVEGPNRAALVAARGPDIGGAARPKILLEVELG